MPVSLTLPTFWSLPIPAQCLWPANFMVDGWAIWFIHPIYVTRILRSWQPSSREQIGNSCLLGYLLADLATISSFYNILHVFLVKIPPSLGLEPRPKAARWPYRFWAMWRAVSPLAYLWPSSGQWNDGKCTSRPSSPPDVAWLDIYMILYIYI